MENTTFRFDLFDIARVFLHWKKKILAFALAVSLITAIYLLTQENYYRAYASFYPASSVISGRINLFRETQQDWIDYFGEENEVDRAFVIGSSSKVIAFLIDSFKMAEHYKIDVKEDKQGAQKVFKKFMKNYLINRTGYNHLEITFTDPDSKLAAGIANTAMNQIEDNLRDIFVRINQQLSLSIDTRKDSIDHQLAVLTDSLVELRVKFGIYDLVSPSRHLVQIATHGSGTDYAQGLEWIQNVEELKDKLNSDRAKYVSLSNEFKTSIFKGFPMIHVVQWAAPYGPKAGPFRTLILSVLFVVSLIFATFLACIVDIFRANRSRYATTNLKD